MATAEQLLAEVTEVDKKLYIDFDTRQILIPDSIHQLGVESDDDVKKLTFNVPRYYYGTDLSEFNIYINYMNAKKEGDVFEVSKNDVIIDEGNTLTFDWIVGRHAVAYKGVAIFNVCMKKGSITYDSSVPFEWTKQQKMIDAIASREGEGTCVPTMKEKPVRTIEYSTSAPIYDSGTSSWKLPSKTTKTLNYSDTTAIGHSVGYYTRFTDEPNIFYSGVTSIGSRYMSYKEKIVYGLDPASVEHVTSDELTAYPEAGWQDGYYYTILNEKILVVEQEFNTTIAKLPVLEGLETSEEVVQEYADILMQWEEQLFGIENSATSNITQKGSEVIGAVNTAGEEQRSQIALKGSEVLSEVANVKNEVTAEGETQKTAITQKGSEVIGAVNTAGEEQKAAIASKGSEVINTVGGQLDIKIPEYIAANPDQFKGEKGDPGQDGISPTLSENKVGKVTTVTVTDGNGTHTFDINDGADGTSVTILGSYSTEAELIAAHPTGNKGDSYLVAGNLYVWDVSTSAWKNVGNIQGPAGIDGTDGIDGVSPTVEISKTGKVTTITITDATGPHTATINDGVDGTGAGDMRMAIYDTDGNGIVDDSEKLGGVAADQYALKTDIPTYTMSATDDGNGNVTISIGG